MITDQGRWDDRDYYDEHFYNIMYDKITEGMKLTVEEMDNLVSAGLFDKEIVPHEEYLEVNDNNQKIRRIRLWTRGENYSDECGNNRCGRSRKLRLL